MLDIGHHNGRGVEVELLHRVVGAEGEEVCSGAIDSKAPDVFEGGNMIRRDLLGPYIP